MAKGRGTSSAAAGASPVVPEEGQSGPGTFPFFIGRSRAPRTKTKIYINRVPTITKMARAGSGRNEDALSEIVGFVLVLALVVVASTLYLMYVVPAEGREDEIEHMNKVQDRFVSYKTSVDGLWLRSLGGAGTQGVSLSTSFDLGTGGGNTQSTGLFLSFMKPIGTAARMRVKSGVGERDFLTLSVDGSLPVEGYDQIPLGQLRYETDNFYWIQQAYEYSAGGVFLEQAGEGVSVKVAPPISAYVVNYDDKGTPDESDDTFQVKMNLCLVNPTGGDALTGGTGPLRVDTRLRENSPPETKQYGTITVRVDARDRKWGDAWERVFLNAASKLDDGWYDVLRSGPDDKVVELTVKDSEPADDVHDVYVDLTRADLQVTFEYAEN